MSKVNDNWNEIHGKETKTILIHVNAELAKQFNKLCFLEYDIPQTEGIRRLMDNAVCTKKIDYIPNGSVDIDKT